MPALFYALRPSQWTKNTLVLAAFFFAFGDRTQSGLGAAAFLKAVFAMVIFCAVSSAIYLINDLRDIEQDRAHPTKRYRPVASGRLGTGTALVTAILLGAAGVVASLVLEFQVFQVISGYVVMQLLYTFALKNVALVDTFVIAIGFVLRALAGGVAIEVEISPWLLLCTFLLALFLGLCKRRHEKIMLEDSVQDVRQSLGQYNQQLLDQLIAIASAATIVCYAIYTLWPETVEKFGTRGMALTIPFVVFGIFRYLDLVYRHEKGDRPEKILLTDIPLLLTIAAYGAVVILVFTL